VPRRSTAVVGLLVVAVVAGGLVGLLVSSFVWFYETGVEWVWVDLPERFDLEPADSWWLFAVPMVGGVLVGLGQRYIGNYPEPIERVLARIRSGERIEPSVAPRTFVNAVVALVAGAPIGFEAALTDLIASASYWVGDRLHTVERFVAVASGREDVEDLPPSMRRLPVWLAVVVGLLVHRFLPFGHLDTSFRFDDFDGTIGAVEALWVVAMSAVVTVLAVGAVRLVQRAETATVYQRAPVVFGVLGGLGFALLAVPQDFVLFSGQQAIQNLEGLGTGALLYLAVAKVTGLALVLLCGWRGGPIFPTLLAAAALATVAADAVDVPQAVLVVGAAAAVSAVFVKGSVPAGFVLALYVAPLSYAGVILVGVVAAATTLAVLGRWRTPVDGVVEGRSS
jgi:H+/Cl- antiporter ClcA